MVHQRLQPTPTPWEVEDTLQSSTKETLHSASTMRTRDSQNSSKETKSDDRGEDVHVIVDFQFNVWTSTVVAHTNR